MKGWFRASWHGRWPCMEECRINHCLGCSLNLVLPWQSTLKLMQRRHDVFHNSEWLHSAANQMTLSFAVKNMNTGSAIRPSPGHAWWARYTSFMSSRTRKPKEAYEICARVPSNCACRSRASGGHWTMVSPSYSLTLGAVLPFSSICYILLPLHNMINDKTRIFFSWKKMD